MEEGLNDRTCDTRPVGVVRRLERLTGALLDDLSEPGIQRAIGREALHHAHDADRLLLEPVHLEALMVEAIDRILESPVARALIEERRQFSAARAKASQERVLRARWSIAAQSDPIGFEPTRPPSGTIFSRFRKMPARSDGLPDHPAVSA